VQIKRRTMSAFLPRPRSQRKTTIWQSSRQSWKKSPISKRQRQMQRTRFRKSSREKSWKSLPRMRTSPVRSVRLSSVPEK
jgi:Uncharacterized protein conserved in bacteria